MSPPGRLRALSRPAILIPAAFVAVGLAWAWVSGQFLSSGLAGFPALKGAGTAISISVFAVFGSIVLHLALRHRVLDRSARAAGQPAVPAAGDLRRPVLVFIAAGAVIALGGHLLYRAQAERLRADRGAELQLLVDLKADQIARWRTELIRNAESDAAFLASLTDIHDHVQHPGGTLDHVQPHLGRLLEARKLHGAAIFDPAGRNIARAGPPVWRGASVQSLIGAAVREGGGQMSGPHAVDDATDVVAIDVAVPLRLVTGAGPPIAAVIVFRFDAERDLLPLVTTTRTGLATLETTILRRNGYDVESLGGLDGQRGRPSGLRLPPERQEFVADRIVRGATGIIEGHDRHGVPSLAAARPIAGSDWIMAAKVSRAEIFAPLLRTTRIAGLLVAAALLCAALLVGHWWRQERHRLVLRSYEAEQRASAMLQHFGTVTQHVNDLVFLLDGDFCIVDVNARVVETLGYARGELVGRHISCLNEDEPALRAAGRAAEARVREVGHAHLDATYVCRDGRHLHFEASARRFEVNGRPFVQSIARDVTERRLQERRIAEISHERDQALRQLRLQFDNLSHGCIVTTPQLEVVQVNPAFERMFGYSAAALAGRDVFDLLLPEQARPYVAERLASLRRGLGPIHEEHAMRASGGRVLECRVSYTPLLDDSGEVAGLMALCEDVTEQRRVERALRERTATLRALAEAAPVGILQVDPAGRVVYHNAQWCEITGWSPEEVLHGDWRRVVHPDDRERLVAGFARASATGHFRSEFRCVTRSGRIVWVLGQTAARFAADGRVAGHVGTITDISDRVAAETAMIELNEQLERRIAERTRELVAARDRAEHSDRVKSQFLATMSHELRTPLNAILGFTDVLLQGMSGPLSEPQSYQLGIVRDSSTHLLDLINDVLDMSRIEAGQLALAIETFDPVELLRRRLASFEPAAAARGLRLELEVAHDAGTLVADPRRVSQIVGNLLSNAVKFTDTGTVRLALHRDGQSMRIAVTDTGPGIAAEHLEEIFESFRQVRSPGGRTQDGTGLGLAISRNLARAMGGDVQVTTRVGMGSTFTLVLPAAVARAA